MRQKYNRYIMLSLSMVVVLIAFYGCSVKKSLKSVSDTIYITQNTEFKRVIKDTFRDTTIVLEYIPDSVGEWKVSKKTVTTRVKNLSGKEEMIMSEEIQKQETKILSETKSRGDNKKWIWLFAGVLISLAITVVLLIRFR